MNAASTALCAVSNKLDTQKLNVLGKELAKENMKTHQIFLKIMNLLKQDI